MKKYFFVAVAVALSAFMFSCKKEDKKNPETPKEPEFTAEVYPEIGERNCILLEEFTGQSCGNCPRAIKSIRATLDAMANGNRVAWVAHHAGYYDDNFTQQGDKDLATLMFYTYSGLSYTYAPAGVVDRSKTKVQTEEGEEDNYIHLADYFADSTLLNNMLAVPAEASINLQAIVLSDSTLKVRVTGKCNQSDAYVTIMLCQNGIVAKQSGGGSNYTHNDIVRAYLTASKGDKLTVDGSNKYSYTATYRIPATISNYKDQNPYATSYKDMYVVAVVHGSSTAKASVYNTDMISLSQYQK